MDPSPGLQVTPTVRLVRPLAAGGMGAVWVADHLALGARVAVKFLKEDVDDAAALARFSREASAAAQVKSAHVVSVYDHGVTSDDTPFIVMELLEGEDLGRRLSSGEPLSPTTVGAIVAQLARALTRAHELGIVHRDIKPGNIFLCTEGGDVFVKLLDFGIAKTDGGVDRILGDSTATGTVVGTPYYMSPEQILGKKGIDGRSDLWAVGVVAYQMLTRRLPFIGETMGAVAIAINDADATPPSKYNSALPAEVDAWFQTACARKPEDRFQTAQDLAASLEAALRGEHRPARMSTSAPKPSVVRVHGSVDTPRIFSDTAIAETIAQDTPQVATSRRGEPKRDRIVFGIAAIATVLMGVAIARVSTRAAPAASSATIAPTTTTTMATATATAMTMTTTTTAMTTTATTTTATTMATTTMATTTPPSASASASIAIAAGVIAAPRRSPPPRESASATDRHPPSPKASSAPIKDDHAGDIF